MILCCSLLGSVKHALLFISSDTLHGSALAFSGTIWCWKALSAYGKCKSDLKFKRKRTACLLCVLEES